MRSLTLRSPAKLNLTLKVINKREDGYHNLVTLFERVDLCDEITFINNSTGRIRITCDHPHVPLGPQNLVYKVARMLKDDFALGVGVDIRIKKRIPVAAGLAGGSSNAATAILALNKIWALGLTDEEMAGYARNIGSDVAFFLYNCSWALGTGRGDVIKKLNFPLKLRHILIVPRIKMYSAEVFGALQQSRQKVKNLKLTKKDDDVNILIRSLRNNDLRRAGQLLFNDLELPIVFLRPQLAKLKGQLQALNPCGAHFSGSGPAIFGLTESKNQAQKLHALFKKKYRQTWVVRTL